MLDQILSHLGFTDEEVKTYLHLLEVGPGTASQLANRLGFPRPSTYGFLSRLNKKGLISESLDYDGTKVFTAESPEKVQLLFQEQINTLQKQEDSYKLLLPHLLSLKTSQLSTPKFQVYKGHEGMRQVIKDGLLYPNTETLSFWPIKDMVDVLTPEFLHYVNKERIKNNISIRTIWPEDKQIDLTENPYMGVGEEMKREIRIAPKEINFSMGYWIYGSKVAFVSSRKESFGFIIESPELVEMLATQFEVLWGLAKPLTIDKKVLKPFLDEIAKGN